MKSTEQSSGAILRLLRALAPLDNDSLQRQAGLISNPVDLVVGRTFCLSSPVGGGEQRKGIALEINSPAKRKHMRNSRLVDRIDSVYFVIGDIQ